MRSPVSLGLLASTLVLSSCLGEGSALLDPTALSEGEISLAPTERQVRIVEPASGTVLRADVAFDVVIRQELRGEPSQGHATLQYSAEGSGWTALGDEFAWSSQERQLVIRGVSLSSPGAVTLRMVVFEADRVTPLLESRPAALHCLRVDATQVAALH